VTLVLKVLVDLLMGQKVILVIKDLLELMVLLDLPVQVFKDLLGQKVILVIKDLPDQMVLLDLPDQLVVLTLLVDLLH